MKSIARTRIIITTINCYPSQTTTGAAGSTRRSLNIISPTTMHQRSSMIISRSQLMSPVKRMIRGISSSSNISPNRSTIHGMSSDFSLSQSMDLSRIMRLGSSQVTTRSNSMIRSIKMVDTRQSQHTNQVRIISMTLRHSITRHQSTTLRHSIIRPQSMIRRRSTTTTSSLDISLSLSMTLGQIMGMIRIHLTIRNRTMGTSRSKSTNQSHHTSLGRQVKRTTTAIKGGQTKMRKKVPRSKNKRPL